MRSATARILLGSLVVGLALALVTSIAPALRETPLAAGPRRPLTFASDPSSRVPVAAAYVPSAGVGEVGTVGANLSLTVDVGLASQDPSGLLAYADATAVPGTPSYHEFLSAATAAERFGASVASVVAARSYFEDYGLSVAAHPDGLVLSVSGSGPDVARAFGTTLDVYRSASGARFVASPTGASLPAVAPWTGALGLDTASMFRPDVVATAPPSAPAPTTGCAASVGGLSPCEVATAYDFPGLEAGGANGHGESIAVIDAYSSAEPQDQLATDFATFTTDEGLSSSNLSFVYPVPTSADLNASGTNPGWNLEDALDVEWARAGAPGASVEMVYSPDAGSGLYFAIDWVVAERAADVISMSWGEPEVGVYNAESGPCSSACNASTDGSFAILDPVLELAAVEGISAFSATGDCGSADGTSGVAANYPASDPFVTAVGATNLTIGSGGSYVAETGWGGNSSGARAPGCVNQGGSGGGFSILPHPWWQTGAGTVATAGRGVPDVAIVGGSGSPVLIDVGGGGVSVSGTSVGTPIWAGIAATADQAHGADLGWLNPSLYRILGNASYPDDFHEIVAGWNGYHAHAGWNAVTGIGTPIVGALLTNLSRTTTAASSLTTYVYASPRFGPAPLDVHFAVDVHSGSGTYPLEGVDFGDGNASTVVAGITNHTFPSPGVYSVQSYAVDSSGNVSTSPAVVVVVGGGTPLTVQLAADTTSPAVGVGVTFTATVSGGSGPFLYNYSFGDGSFAENQSATAATHTYTTAGTFCAEVVARSLGSRPDGGASLRVPVAVGGAPSSSCGNPTSSLVLSANTTEGVRDAPADFPSLFAATGGATAPDGLTSQVAVVSTAPANPYTSACGCTIVRSPGTYALEEWENDTVNGEANASATVTVAPPLNATFTASTLAGTVPLSVQFSAAAAGGYDAAASSTHWAFGNALSATGSAVSTTYTSPGEYVAIASLADRGYGNASEAFVIDAEGAGSSAVGVTATVSPAVNVSSGATVHWAASIIGPPSSTSGDVIAWGFGNGGSAFGPYANETYFASIDLLAGNDLVASVAVDGPRLTTLVTVPITLPGFFATEAAGFIPAVDALELTEDVVPASGPIPLAVSGTASATGPGGAAVTWLFGDGGSGAGDSVAHVYYGAGDYSVQVEAYDGFNDLAVRTDSVVANAALSLSGCGAPARAGTAPYTVGLDPTASGGAGPPYSYRWTLPNGTGSTATNVTLTFSSAGTYTVSVVVTDAANAMYDCVWSIVVTAVPTVSALDVLVAGLGAGLVLAAVFLWATRPRSPA